MTDKIEVGEYVRTKLGEIAKIVDTNMYDNTIYKDMQGARYYLEDIVNHSKNIIDLIQVGDYVNGRLVLDNVANMYLLVSSSDFNNNKIFDYMIKSIVTKENFKNNSYKVVE